MCLEGTCVLPDSRKGLIRVGRDEEGLVHFQWLDRFRNVVEDELNADRDLLLSSALNLCLKRPPLGLTALIMQKFSNFSPSAIGSALSTAASLYNMNGGPISAQQAHANPDLNQSPDTQFDMGSGFVNGTAVLDPGLSLISSSGSSLILAGKYLHVALPMQKIGYDEYTAFLCSINRSAPVFLNYNGEPVHKEFS